MSLTKIATAPARRLNWHEKAAHARYEKKVARAEREELKMLRRVHQAYTVKGTPLDLDHAAKLVVQSAGFYGLSWHETLFQLYFFATHPTRAFFW
jgi:hypothetical protein